MLRVPLGNHWLDSQPTQQGPSVVAVVATIRVHRVGMFFRPATLPSNMGKSSTSGMICVWSLALAPAVRMASGVPWRSTINVCFEPGFPRSTGLGPVASPPPKAHLNAVDDRGMQIN